MAMPPPPGRFPGRPPFRDDAGEPRLPRPPDPNRICGAAAVRALFLHRPQAVLRLFFTPDRAVLARPLCGYMARQRRPYREVGLEEIARVAGTQHHGGIVAVAQARFAEPLPGHALPPDLPAAPVLPVLEGIGNPHNLGAVARSAAFFGCRALLLSGDPRQADLSDAAFRTAEGGLEQLRVLRARNLPALLKGMRQRFLTLAAVAAGGVPPQQVLAATGDRRPIALVLGNEEEGLPAETLEACEARVTLAGPGAAGVESLNVSAAAAVLLYAFSGRGG
jgi:TrmH RNA methyltransferase